MTAWCSSFISLLLPTLFIVSSSTIYALETKTKETDNEKIGEHETFICGNNKVHIVSDFLPKDLAVKWRDQMANEWDAVSGSSSETCTNSDKCNDASPTSTGSWQYATNNDGIVRNSNNAKIRNLHKIEARNETAQVMRRQNRFSYAKWELEPTHSLVQEIENALASRKMRNRITNLLQPHHPKIQLDADLSDLFVTYYGSGDFLSKHNDGSSGTWAFVISLMDGPGEWKADEYGGSLVFQCGRVIKPKFNSAVFFQSRPGNGLSGPVHEVLPVSWKAEADGYRRFGFTGWYLDVNDNMPDHVKAERDLMRARVNKID